MAWFVALVACVADPSAARGSDPSAAARVIPATGTPGNFLLVIVDDVSASQLPLYGITENQAITPTMDSLAAAGLRFDAAYGYASCSPARAAMYTGRYPSRNGLGNAIDEDDGETVTLPLAEVTLGESLRQSPYGYTSSFVGKWHLGAAVDPSSYFAPLDQGFDWFAGTWANTGDNHEVPGIPTNYSRWERVENGARTIVSGYVTTATADDAIERARVMPEPWLLVTSFNAPHVPYHLPPANLVNTPLPATCVVTAECARAALEAADTELGRLLAGIDPDVLARTTIVLTSDNGPPGGSILPPLDPTEAKGTMTDGGLRLPLIVAGPHVATPGASTDALVSITDLFATFNDLAEVGPLVAWDGTPLQTDSRSFVDVLQDPTLPGSPVVYSEHLFPQGAPPYNRADRMVRTPDFKYARWDGQWQLWPYAGDAEGDEVLQGKAPSAAWAQPVAELSALLDSVVATTAYEGP